MVWAVPYLSDGIMRRARRWAWVLRGPDDLPPSDGILMGFQAGLPAKRFRIPTASGRARAQGQGPGRVVAGSPGSSPPEVVIREIPFACDPVLSSTRGSWQVLAPSDHGPRPLRRCDPLYVRSEPVPQFVAFLSMFFAFLPWMHRALSCGVLLLMRRLHMFVLLLFVTCEDFRLRTAPDVIFDVLKDFTADSWDPLVHLSTSPVPQLGKVDPELVGRGLDAMGSYEISDELWQELAPVDFAVSVAEFSLPWNRYSPTREDNVLPMVRWLLDAGVVNIMDRGCPLKATCWPFIIPKTTEKVSLIFNLVD